jgi:hypothetical protein
VAESDHVSLPCSNLTLHLHVLKAEHAADTVAHPVFTDVAQGVLDAEE